MQAQELHDQMDAAKKEIAMKEKAKAGREQVPRVSSTFLERPRCLEVFT